MSSSCHFDLRSILSLKETSVGCFYNEALEDECDSTVNSTVVWTNIQFDAFLKKKSCLVSRSMCHIVGQKTGSRDNDNNNLYSLIEKYKKMFHK